MQYHQQYYKNPNTSRALGMSPQDMRVIFWMPIVSWLGCLVVVGGVVLLMVLAIR